MGPRLLTYSKRVSKLYLTLVDRTLVVSLHREDFAVDQVPWEAIDVVVLVSSAVALVGK